MIYYMNKSTQKIHKTIDDFFNFSIDVVIRLSEESPD